MITVPPLAEFMQADNERFSIYRKLNQPCTPVESESS
jgi:hypothetical protein